MHISSLGELGQQACPSHKAFLERKGSSHNEESRHTSELHGQAWFCFASLGCTWQAQPFYRLEVWPPAMSLQVPFAHSVSLCHLLVILLTFQMFPLLLVMVIEVNSPAVASK